MFIPIYTLAYTKVMKSALSTMSKRSMTNIMSKGNRINKIFI